MHTYMDLTKEHEFLVNADLSEFEGEWIAVGNRKILAHGNVLKDVCARAEKEVKHPLLYKVPRSDVLHV
jgi:hypothetical protein